MNVTDALIVPKTVGFAVSCFILLLTFSLMIGIPIRRNVVEFEKTDYVEEVKRKKKPEPRKRSLLFPICLPLCILSVVFGAFFSNKLFRSYDGIVLHSIIFYTIFYFFVFAVLVALAIVVIRCSIKDDWEIVMTLFCLLLCLAAIAFLLYTVFTDVPPKIQDFREKSYVTYTGEFKTTTLRRYKQRTELLDGSGIKVYGSGEYQGTFSGTVVYSERSHIRLEVRYSD